MSDHDSASKPPSEWFVRRGDTEHGPFSPKQIRAMAKKGKITSDNFVRRGRSTNWVKASSIKGLFRPADEQTGHVATPTEPTPSTACLQPKRSRNVRKLVIGCGGAFVLMILVCNGLMHLGSKARDTGRSLAERAAAPQPAVGHDAKTTNVREFPAQIRLVELELAQMEESEGPNGEPLLIGGSGKQSGFWYQYFISDSGDEIKHGKFHGPMPLGDSNGTGTIEADYNNGVLVRRVGWDGAGRIVDTMRRQADGTYLWDEVRPIWKDVRVRYRSVATKEGRSTKDLKAVLLTGDTVHDRSIQYTHGFVKGIKLALPAESEMQQAVNASDTKSVNRILLQTLRDVEHYRRQANDQLQVGGNSELLFGTADGLVYVCERFPVDAESEAVETDQKADDSFPSFALAKGVWKCRKTGLNFFLEPLIVTGPDGKKGIPKSIATHRTALFSVSKSGEEWTFDFHENGIIYASPKRNVENKRSRIGRFSFDGQTLDIKLALTASRKDLGNIPWEYEFELVRP